MVQNESNNNKRNEYIQKHKNNVSTAIEKTPKKMLAIIYVPMITITSETTAYDDLSSMKM